MAVKVVFQGVAGAYSELAALSFFGSGAKIEGLPEFRDVFRAVRTGRAGYGIVPIENALTGSIYQNFDLILEYPLWICGEVKFRIHHALIAHPGVSIGKLRRVYSHPQGLWQCEGFLTDHPHIERIPHFDTAGSAKFVKESGDREAAAIASASAAQRYGLKTLKNGIEDNRRNFTRFLVLSRTKKAVGDGPAKTSVLFTLKNRSGELYRALGLFADRSVQISKIESRPIPGSPWEYQFFLDYESRCDRGVGKEVLRALKAHAASVRVLGCYRQARKLG